MGVSVQWGSLSRGISVQETPIGQRCPGQRPPRQSPHWTETPLDRDPIGQRPPLDRDTLDRDPQTETPRDPPGWGSLSGGSLSRALWGVPVRGFPSRESLSGTETPPPYGKEWAVRILFDCILFSKCFH